MGLQMNEWVLQLWNIRKRQHFDDDTGKVIVMNAGAPTKVTLFSDVNGTSLANPLTITNGEIRFFAAPSVTQVDLAIVTALGISLFYEDVTPSQGRVDIDPDVIRCRMVLPFGVSDNVEVDSGVDLPSNVLVDDVALKVTTVDATETLAVGLLSSESGGDADGFLVDASVANLGYVHTGGAINDGGTIDFTNGVNYGVLLASFINGSNAVATEGGVIRKKYWSNAVTAKSITYTGSAGSDTAAGYIYISYERLP